MKIRTSQRLQSHLQNVDLNAIGLLLHQLYITDMYTYAKIRIGQGGGLMSALQDYCDLYNIDECDYSLDTAYRGFNRRYGKKIEAINKKTAKNKESVRIQKPVNLLQVFGQVETLSEQKLPARLVENICFQIENCDNSVYEKRDKKPQTLNRLRMIIYLINKVSGLSYGQIAKRTGIPRQTVADYVKALPELLHKDQDMPQKLSGILQELRIRRFAVLPSRQARG